MTYTITVTWRSGNRTEHSHMSEEAVQALYNAAVASKAQFVRIETS